MPEIDTGHQGHRLRQWLFPVGVVLALVAGPATGRPEDTPASAGGDVLTLAQAIATAMEHNREIGAAEARSAAAEAQLDEARSLRLPRVDITGVAQSTDHPVYVFSNLLGQESFGAESFAVDELNDPDPLTNWKTQVDVTQPLWTGGRLRHGIAAAEAGRDAERASQEATRQHVVHQVIERYTAAVLARRELEVAREALATAGAHVQLVGDLHRGGLVVESDLLQAQVRASEIEEMVIRAESGVEVSAAALNLAMGRPLDEAMRLPATLDVDPSLEVGETLGEDDLDALLDQAAAKRPDLRSARGHGDAAEAVARQARAERLPEVGLQAHWEANAEDFIGRDGDGYSVSVALTYRLFDGGARRARLERARRQLDEARERQDLLAQGVALEVHQAFHELRAATQRLDQARRGVRLAERSLAIVKDRYREGLTILPELLDAETARTRARLREVAARRDVRLGRASLDLATGNL